MNAQEREFSIFQIPKWLRSGIMIGFLSLSLAVNWSLSRKVDQLYKEKDEMQKELYEKMIIYVDPTLKRVNKAADKVDTLANNIMNQNR
jgi:hypothetical protein